MSGLHWLGAELAKHFDGLNLLQGVDLNRDGKFDDTERLDTNSDGEIDIKEWKIFLNNNETKLKALGGIFDNYFDYGRSFSLDNPLHDLLFVESKIATDADINKTYQEVEKLYTHASEAKDNIDMMIGSEASQLSARAQLGFLWLDMEHHGFHYDEDASNVATASSKKIANHHFDCDTASFIIVSVEHELSNPVYVVELPAHAFVRWDDGKGVRFNMDSGISVKDDVYAKKFNLSPEVLSNNIYLRNFEYNDLLSFFYLNRGGAYKEVGEYAKAEKDFDTTLAFNRRFVVAWWLRGYMKYYQRRYDEALSDINTALYYDPDNAVTYGIRGQIEYVLGNYMNAKADLESALALDPYPLEYALLALTDKRLGLDEEASRAMESAVAMNPLLVNANDLPGVFFYQGIYDFNDGYMVDAVENFSAAILHDPDNLEAYFMLGGSYGELGYVDAARRTLLQAFMLDPIATTTFLNESGVIL